MSNSIEKCNRGNFRTHYSIYLAITGSQTFLNDFLKSIQSMDSFAGKSVLEIKKGKFILEYKKEHVLWNDTNAANLQNIIEKVKYWNSYCYADLSCVFHRATWWNLRFAEFRSSAGSFYFDKSILRLDRPCFVETRPISFRTFVNQYIECYDKEGFLNMDIDSFVDEWNPEEADYICALYQWEITDTVFVHYGDTLLAHTLKKRLRSGTSFMSIRDKRFTFSAAVSAMQFIIEHQL
ncbi:MAG: hypothetical protein K2Q14_04630 [Gammaproteobacteria bacterium]|nr:hypothetical protein [Gammaproteobacteria bacterium]MBY0544817.1 hypothetical protein [Gammaproteobacteria bacterium]